MGKRPDGPVATRKPARLTRRDQEILVFLTRYWAATAEQVRREFFGSLPAAYRRLGILRGLGLVEGERIYFEGPGVYRVTGAGARLAAVDLPAPRLDLSKLRHTLAVVDLSYAIRHGDDVWAAWFTERELRRDALRERRGETGRMRPGGKMGRTPDGLLVLQTGEQVAIELELTPKRIGIYKDILKEYAKQKKQQRIDLVRFYFNSEKAAERLGDLAKRLGMAGFVEVKHRVIAAAPKE